VKLLFEANLSRRLLRRLDDFFSGSIRVQFEGFGEGPDREIWDFAGANGFVVVTADADFFEMASTLGPPPKAISLKGCDYPTVEAELLMRQQAIRVSENLLDVNAAVLVLRAGIKQ
jgi:predicted nuclease of predicted toxin-antitoxin system